MFDLAPIRYSRIDRRHRGVFESIPMTNSDGGGDRRSTMNLVGGSIGDMSASITGGGARPQRLGEVARERSITATWRSRRMYKPAVVASRSSACRTVGRVNRRVRRVAARVPRGSSFRIRFTPAPAGSASRLRSRIQSRISDSCASRKFMFGRTSSKGLAARWAGREGGGADGFTAPNGSPAEPSCAATSSTRMVAARCIASGINQHPLRIERKQLDPSGDQSLAYCDLFWLAGTGRSPLHRERRRM